MTFLKERFVKETREFISGKLITSGETIGANSVTQGAFVIPEMEEGKTSSVLFRIMVGNDVKYMRVEPDSSWDPDEVKPKDLYFISNWDISTSSLTISVIPMCLLQERNEIEILFDAEYINNRNKKTKGTLHASDIARQLERDYVFNYFGRQRLFVSLVERSDDMYVYGVGGRRLLVQFKPDRQK